MAADHYLTAELEVGGARRTFLIDTGAAFSLIDDDVAASLGLVSVGKQPMIDFSGVRRDVDAVRIPSLRLGSLEALEVGAAVIDMSGFDAIECEPIAGLIGMNVLRGAIELDVSGGWLRLASSMSLLAPRAGGVTIKAYPPSYLLHLPPPTRTLAPTPVTVDTGSPGAITVTKAMARRLATGPRLRRDVLSQSLNSARPRRERHDLFLWPDATLAGLELEGVRVEVAGSATIGLAVLRSFVVRVDREAQTLTFWPDPSRPPPRGLEGLGVWIAAEGEAGRVRSVTRGSPASAAGLRLGEPVVSLDGARLAEMTAQARCTALRDLHKKEQVRVGVRRAGAVVEVALTRRTMLAPPR